MNKIFTNIGYHFLNDYTNLGSALNITRIFDIDQIISTINHVCKNFEILKNATDHEKIKEEIEDIIVAIQNVQFETVSDVIEMAKGYLKYLLTLEDEIWKRN